MLAIPLVDSLLSVASTYFSTRVSTGLTYILRTRLYKHLQVRSYYRPCKYSVISELLVLFLAILSLTNNYFSGNVNPIFHQYQNGRDCCEIEQWCYRRSKVQDWPL